MVHKRDVKTVSRNLETSGGDFTTTFQLNPFSSVGGVVSTRFEFNWRGRLGVVTQKLSR